MNLSEPASTVLRRARRTAGLSQRALALKAGTAQSVIARIESGQTDPGYSTLIRILAAADFELHARPSAESARPLELDSSYLNAVAWVEQRPANQSGVDKTWVDDFLEEDRRHYESAVRVR